LARKQEGFFGKLSGFKIFLQEDVPVRLGVSKRLSSIRYWCNALQNVEEDTFGSLKELEEEQVPHSLPSNKFTLNCLSNQRGSAPVGLVPGFFSSNPFLKIASLYAAGICYPSSATAWDFARSNYFRSVEFSVDDLFFVFVITRDGLSITFLFRHYLHSLRMYTGNKLPRLNLPVQRKNQSPLALE